MHYLPYLLARKFNFFAKLSIFQIWGVIFGPMILLALSMPFIASLSGYLIMPLFGAFSLYTIGVISSKYYVRKFVILTDPLAVKVSASEMGDQLGKLGGKLLEFVFLFFFYFTLLMCIILIFVPFLVIAYT
ncbi:hypothetical protein [Vibrio harveyi]|uniref:hypothetical protein n=1 Tax=Vibrio harveyi TaxID=669 RepID=UPI003BB4D02F